MVDKQKKNRLLDGFSPQAHSYYIMKRILLLASLSIFFIPFFANAVQCTNPAPVLGCTNAGYTMDTIITTDNSNPIIRYILYDSSATTVTDMGTYWNINGNSNQTIWADNFGQANYTNVLKELLVSWEGADFHYVDTDTSTRIIEIVPANGANIATTTATGATTTLSVSYYINPDDIGWFTGISVTVRNVDQNYVYGFSTISPYTFLSTCETDINLDCEAGYHEWTREIWLPIGGYAIHASLQGNFLGVTNPITSIWQAVSESQDDSVPMAQYHYYTIGQNSAISALRQNMGNQVEQLIANAASTTIPSASDCNFLTGFEFVRCLSFIFIPSSSDLQQFGDTLASGILSKFPLGYLWNFYEILRDDTAATLPLIDATVPDVLPGAGSRIQLSISSSTLDYLYTATTSIFYNDSVGVSEATLFQTVSYYWNILVYMGIAMYLLSRILGSHIIGNIFSEEWSGTSSDVKKVWSKIPKRYDKDIRNVKIKDYSNYSEREWRNAKNNRLL